MYKENRIIKTGGTYMLHFPTEKIDAHITRIYAFGTELMYLVEGSEGNVLLDTGSGFGSLKAATERHPRFP